MKHLTSISLNLKYYSVVIFRNSESKPENHQVFNAVLSFKQMEIVGGFQILSSLSALLPDGIFVF